MNEINFVVVEKTNTVMAITSDELAAIQKCRKAKEREALVEKYRNEMAELLRRMEQDCITLECRTTYCRKLASNQPKNRIRIE